MKKLLTSTLLLIIMCISYLRAEQPPKQVSIGHIAVASTDIDSSLMFYRDFMGFQEMNRLNYVSQSSPNKGALMLVNLKIADHQYIEVFDGYTAGANTIHQIALRVDDIHAIHKTLKEAGYDVENVGVGQMKSYGMCFTEPNGYTVEVNEFLPEGMILKNEGRFIPSAPASKHLFSVGIKSADTLLSDKLYCDIWGFKREANRYMIDNGAYELVITGDGEPYICFKVEDINQTEKLLRQRKKEGLYNRSINVRTSSDKSRYIELRDPLNLKVVISEDCKRD